MSLQRRIMLMVVGLLLIVLLPTILIFTLNTRSALIRQAEANGQLIAELLAQSTGFIERVPQEAESFISDQMVVQAEIAAHMVAIAEQDAGLTPEQINQHLQEIVNSTVLDEFWITDENGYAYLRSEPGIEFSFDPDPAVQPQAYVFWDLLTGEVNQLAQEAQVREVDDRIFKYVGVSGVDHPRIVQVGYNFGILNTLTQEIGLPNLVERLIHEESVNAIWIVDEEFNLLAAEGLNNPEIDANINAVDEEKIRDVLRDGSTLQYTEAGFLRVIIPVMNNDQTIGAVLIYVSLESVNDALQQALIFSIGLSVVVIGAGIIASQFLSHWISQPIQHLSQAAGSIAMGEWDYDVPITRDDEVGALARAFSKMAARIRDLVNQLEERVADRTRDLQLATASSVQLVSELQLAYTVGRKIAEIYDLPDYRQRMMSVLAQSFDLYTALLFIPDEDNKRLVLRAAADSQGVSVMPDVFPEIDLMAKSTIALAARTREIVAINDVTKSNVYMEFDTLPETSAEIAIPLIVGDELVGVLDLQSENVNTFDNNMLRFMESIGSQVALTIKNATLRQETSSAQMETQEIRHYQAEFIRDLSHDVRKPLYDLLDTTEMVADGFMGEITSSQARSLHSVVDKGDELLATLNETLNISRILVDGLPLYIEHISLNQSLESIIQIVRDLLKNRPITLVADIADNLPELYVDDRRVRQIFLGLLSNAVKYTQDGTITIRIQREDEMIHAKVEDTGSGILPEERDSIFSMAMISRQESIKGASRALRLPMTRKLVEAHGGKIWFETEPGKGTTFHVTLLIAMP